jgi:hypothetical protein
MQFKSKFTKAIQQEDVWSAADALIAEGLRPTIERVRQKIGRGSPNTVSPMLEAWFATLASRLGVNSSKDDPLQVPKILQQAMKDLWEIALSHAQEEAGQQMEEAQISLDAKKEALKIRENELAQQEQVLLAKHHALEDALKAAVDKAEYLMSRLQQAEASASRQQTETESLQTKFAVVESERDLARRRLDDEMARHNEERLKHEERSQAAQHKLLQDVDRARQETKKMQNDAQLSQKRFDAERNLMQQKNCVLESDLSKAQETLTIKAADLKALREALAISNLRSDEIRNLLEKQQTASEITISHLTQALSIRLDQHPETVKPLVRKIKRPIRLQNRIQKF